MYTVCTSTTVEVAKSILILMFPAFRMVASLNTALYMYTMYISGTRRSKNTWLEKVMPLQCNISAQYYMCADFPCNKVAFQQMER